MKSLLTTLILCFCLAGCGGNGAMEGTPLAKPIPQPETNPPLDSDLASLYENTFEENGSNISVTPSTLDFGTSTQGEPSIKFFTLQNNTKTSQRFHIDLMDTIGGVSLMEKDGYDPTEVLELGAGQAQKISLKFDAKLMGKKIGRLEITSENTDGYIRLPFKASVKFASDFKILSTDYLCENKKAPQLDLIDFFKSSSGTLNQKTMKICNTGAKALRINSIRFIKADSDLVSKIFSMPPAEEALNWDILHQLNENFFSYYNPETLEPYEAPKTVTYTGAIPSPNSIFRSMRKTAQGFKEINNLTLAPEEFVLFEVFFRPHLEVDAGEDTAFKPVSLTANMILDTSLGEAVVNVVGATGGVEPSLKLVQKVATDTEGKPLPEASDPCNIYPELDLNSIGASLNFGEARIFADWINEDFTVKDLYFCNIGSGSRPLKVWMDPMEEGYFTYHESEEKLSFPLSIPANEFRKLSLKYAPTPANNKASKVWDFSRTLIRHTGGNGPAHPLTLIGEQTDSAIIEVNLHDARIKPTSTSKDKRKNLLCATIAKTSAKRLTIHNFSKQNSLTSTIVAHPLEALDEDGKPTKLGNAVSIVDIDNETKLDFAIDPGATAGMSLLFNLPKTVKKDTTLIGRLSIINHFSVNIETQTGQAPPSFEIYYKVTASKTDECKIVGAGQPLDGTAIVVIDRITMNMPGPLTDPARNPPAFKFYLPVDLDQEKGRARIHGLPFDPTENANPVDQIRSYAHQISSVQSCKPLPTNPYKLEFEDGSWDGPGKECKIHFALDPELVMKGSAVCMANNAAQTVTVDDPSNPGQIMNVFFHEFMKYDPDTCTPEFEGKIATLAIRPDQTIAGLFAQMEKNPGLNKSSAEYAAVTRPFQFGSYIKFFKASSRTNCTYPANTVVSDPNALEACWNSFKDKTVLLQRHLGMVEECSYFQFEIAEGCGPENLSEARCAGVDMADPSTWQGYGEYELADEIADETGDETKYHLTFRNVNIKAFSLVHSLNSLFDHEGRLLFSDMFVTLTTKAVGRTYAKNSNTMDDDWQSLIAERTKADFNIEGVQRRINDTTKTYWTEDGVNSSLTVGDAGNFDDRDCAPEAGVFDHCRGNFEFTEDGKLVHAGEPIDYSTSFNRLMLVGLSSFHGKGQLAPSFAREDNGIGKPLYFTFHACIKTPEFKEDGTPTASGGCYEEKLDETLLPDSQELVRSAYVDLGLLASEDDPKALINFRILDDDRNRLTNYYLKDPFEFDERSKAKAFSPCAYGN